MKPKQKTDTKMLQVIREAVEAVTSCDVVLRTRQVEYVQARMIFYKLFEKSRQ